MAQATWHFLIFRLSVSKLCRKLSDFYTLCFAAISSFPWESPSSLPTSLRVNNNSLFHRNEHWSRFNVISKPEACIEIDIQRSLCYQLNSEFTKNDFYNFITTFLELSQYFLTKLTAWTQRSQNWLRQDKYWPFLAFLMRDLSLLKMYFLGHWCSCKQNFRRQAAWAKAKCSVQQNLQTFHSDWRQFWNQPI